ncbi:MAG: precorrin-2 C(20)-methyltransferase [Parvibaculum sp.]|uniref:precorrin-2 C(20)-methyltransferase n=1 Tax=Parvibaculum sp. TaxID=2024848 RepID=UPI0025FD6E22|nr:precorrin-2 C(20)-methyltransferase [Parvibaculum sp.]MCE9649039.1 precorrin-2 C(20)-methyltransferase [Parvibaculum sp.]
MAAVGTLYGIGVGPGDPELLTVKAARLIGASPVIAYFAKRGGKGTARMIAHGYFGPSAVELPLYYPVTVELSATEPEYHALLVSFYDEAAAAVALHLAQGRDVVVLCEGDPLFYGSYMYLHDRIAPRFPSVVVPGVTGMAGCAATAGLPMTYGNDVLLVVPGTLGEDELERRLAGADAAVIMKLGRNFPKVRRVLERLGLADRSTYVERGTMPGGHATPLMQKADDTAPYFSLVLVPGRERRVAAQAEAKAV